MPQLAPAQDIQIKDSKLSAVNMGLDSSQYWIEKMKAGDQRRAKTLRRDLEKLKTRFQRIPEVDTEAYRFVKDRFDKLSKEIDTKANQNTNKPASPKPASPRKATPSQAVSNPGHQNAQTQSTPPKPDRNLIPVNNKLNHVEQLLAQTDPSQGKQLRELRHQLLLAQKSLDRIAASKEPTYLATSKRFNELRSQVDNLFPKWKLKIEPSEYLKKMRMKYFETLLVPQVRKMMRQRELTAEDISYFIDGVKNLRAGIQTDAETIRDAHILTGTHRDLVTLINEGAAENLSREMERLEMKLDQFISKGVQDLVKVSESDIETNKYSFVTESVRKMNEDKYNRLRRSLVNVQHLEKALQMSPKWSKLMPTLDSAIKTYRQKAEQAAFVKSLPQGKPDNSLKKIATQVLALEKYQVGEIHRLIITSKIFRRDRKDTRFFNDRLETTVRAWEEFQVCTVEKEGEKYFVYFNTLRKFSRGDTTTPIDKWILSIRFKAGQILKEQLD